MEGNTVCKESTSRFVPKCLLFPFWVRKTCQKLSPCGVKPQRSLPVILARFLWGLARCTRMMIIQSHYLCAIRFPLLTRNFLPPNSLSTLGKLRLMEPSLLRLIAVAGAHIAAICCTKWLQRGERRHPGAEFARHLPFCRGLSEDQLASGGAVGNWGLIGAYIPE